MDTRHLTRQMDIIPLSALGEQITIIGAGAIGGWTTLSLAKMGFGRITVFDHDEVGIENMNAQLYRFQDIGMPKVFALAGLIEDFTGVRINAIQGRYEKGVFPGIVISAVDSMEARKVIWQNHAGQAATTKAVIDPRMGAETALLYTMSPTSLQDCTEYPNSLYSDDQAVQERCTAKATVYTAGMIAGLVCKAVKNIVTGNPYPRTVQWSIKHNQFNCWDSTGKKS